MYDAFRRVLLIVAGGAVALLLIGIGTAFAKVKNDIRDSVVIVACLDETGEPIKFGTGTVISTYQVLTAAHVVTGCSSVETKFFSDLKRKAVIQKIGNPEDFDFAVLALSVPYGVPVIPLSKGVPEQGEHLTLIAHPRGLMWTRVEATVSLVDTGVADSDMLVDVTSAQGASGGAMLNAAGEIVGILVAGLMSGPNGGDYTGFSAVELISNIKKFFPEDLQ